MDPQGDTQCCWGAVVEVTAVYRHPSSSGTSSKVLLVQWYYPDRSSAPFPLPLSRARAAAKGPPHLLPVAALHRMAATGALIGRGAQPVDSGA